MAKPGGKTRNAKAARIPRVTNLPRLPPAPVLRMFLLAMCAVALSAWALVRYYEHGHAHEGRRGPTQGAAPSTAPSEIPIDTE